MFSNIEYPFCYFYPLLKQQAKRFLIFSNPLRAAAVGPPPGNTRKRRRPLIRRLGAAMLILGMLLFTARFWSSGTSPTVEEAPEERPPRQRVIIFLIDTVDDFDTHGVYVHSVLRQHCPLCEVQAMNLQGDLALSSVIHALQQVHTQSQTYDPVTTTLVNLSLGTYTYDRGLHAAVRALEAAGVVLIASAGNDNTARQFYPAAFREVLGVCSSTRHTKVKAVYSNFGPWVGLCAPGLQYVSRPLQQGEIASGTSLAAPMVAGVLGQILLEAPCASPRAGVRALLRTADPMPERTAQTGAGVLNPAAASHYIHNLYPCTPPDLFLQRLLRRIERLGTRAGMTLGIVAYFLLSIFTIPFLLAFVIEQLQRHTARCQQQALQQALQQACTQSPADRRHRLLTLRHLCLHTRKMRRRERMEVFALLWAIHLHGEPCWWCDQPPAQQTSNVSPQVIMACSRCGMVKLTCLPPASPQHLQLRQ
jgi:hypothetical protein